MAAISCFSLAGGLTRIVLYTKLNVQYSVDKLGLVACQTSIVANCKLARPTTVNRLSLCDDRRAWQIFSKSRDRYTVPPQCTLISAGAWISLKCSALRKASVELSNRFEWNFDLWQTDGRTGGHEATDDTALAQRRMSKQVRVEPHPSALAVTLSALLLLLLFFITPYTAAHKHTNTKKLKYI